MINPLTLQNNLHELMTQHDDSSDYEPDEHANLDDYECASNVDILNIFICHYKQLCLAESLDPSGSPSCDPENIMEYVHTETQKYHNSNDNTKDVLFDIDDDIDTTQTLYCLLINSEPLYISPYIVTLMNYLCTVDWYKINWSIITL